MKNISLSIVIPVYNESKRLKRTFTELEKLKLPRGIRLEKIIFVNDGSTDRTKFQISNFINRHSGKNNYTLNAKRYTLVSYPQNMGKGYALRMGLTSSTSDYTLIADADMSTPLSEIKKFTKAMSKNTDLIIGTRKNGHSTVLKHQPILREYLGKGFTLLTKAILGIDGTDFTCGFKAFSRNSKNTILENAIINRWAYDSEWILVARRNNLTRLEVPVVWSNDADTKVHLAKDIYNSVLELLNIKKKDILGEYTRRTVLQIIARQNAVKA